MKNNVNHIRSVSKNRGIAMRMSALHHPQGSPCLAEGPSFVQEMLARIAVGLMDGITLWVPDMRNKYGDDDPIDNNP